MVCYPPLTEQDVLTVSDPMVEWIDNLILRMDESCKPEELICKDK